MGDETKQILGAAVAVGAEAVSLASTDWTPGLKTPDDKTTLVPRALYVGVAGDVKVDMADGTTAIIFSNAPVGVLPISITKIYKIGTAATNIVALY